ncbi:hypothetical protein M902_1450 [Bacteriovorax sp. BAL6_X]|uniref:hypothetical protein n=1 Tax=Bacteriovorax sp. BAL6_X TaxID=1201290 RepID=UPI000386DD98|nr:hypothetical protein [Bacteriovorax sp. BAL6_X]EPZ50470.1 hypothetical protein M902_1450 [Bacteriovorax sp. BAL6_X]
MHNIDPFTLLSTLFIINIGVYLFTKRFTKKLFSLFTVIVIFLLLIDLRVQESISLGDGVMIFIYSAPIFLIINAIFKEFKVRQGLK